MMFCGLTQAGDSTRADRRKRNLAQQICLDHGILYTSYYARVPCLDCSIALIVLDETLKWSVTVVGIIIVTTRIVGLYLQPPGSGRYLFPSKSLFQLSLLTVRSSPVFIRRELTITLSCENSHSTITKQSRSSVLFVMLPCYKAFSKNCTKWQRR